MRPKRRQAPTATASLFAASCALWWSCGSNLFTTLETPDPAEDAVIDLEKNDPETAIATLEDALAKDPGNPKYLSVLSAAYAQRAGIEPIRFASKVAENGGGEGGGSFAGLYAYVPTPTTRKLADIDKAVSILVSDIAQEDYQPGDTFKVGLFQTASLVLHTKALDADGDGKVSASEAVNLSDVSAQGLLSQIASAQAILATAGSDNPTMQKAAETLAKYQSQIDASPGGTSEEKLQSFITTATGGADASSFATATSVGTGTGS